MYTLIRLNCAVLSMAASVVHAVVLINVSAISLSVLSKYFRSDCNGFLQ